MNELTLDFRTFLRIILQPCSLNQTVLIRPKHEYHRDPFHAMGDVYFPFNVCILVYTVPIAVFRVQEHCVSTPPSRSSQSRVCDTRSVRII